MKIATLPKYVRHPSFRDSNSLNGVPAAHAMMRGPTVVVDANAFLYAHIMYDDAFYPDEPDGTNGDTLVIARFAKGSSYIDIVTKASELSRVMGRNSLPGIWLGRKGRDALEPRV